MLILRTTASRNGVFQFNPGPATRANFPSRCTMATCAVSTMKHDPSTTLKMTMTAAAASRNSSIVNGSISTLLRVKQARALCHALLVRVKSARCPLYVIR
jgi:hypothetical protein